MEVEQKHFLLWILALDQAGGNTQEEEVEGTMDLPPPDPPADDDLYDPHAAASDDDDDAESDDVRMRLAKLEAMEHGELDWDDDDVYGLGRGQSWSSVDHLA